MNVRDTLSKMNENAAKIRLYENIKDTDAEVQRKMDLANEYIRKADELIKQADEMSARLAGAATKAGVEPDVDVSDDFKEAHSAMGGIGYALGRLAKNLTIFFGSLAAGAYALNRSNDNRGPSSFKHF